MSGKTVVVADGGSGQGRSAVAAVRALAAAGYRPVVTRSGRRNLAAASRLTAASAWVPPVATDPEGFAAAVRAVACEHGALTVLPASDAALLALGAPVGDLVDKRCLMDRAQAAGLAAPPTTSYASVDDLRSADAELAFPIVVKPVVSRAPAQRVDGPGQLSAIEVDGPVVVQPFLAGGLRSIAGVVWKGELVAAVHQRYERTWPVDCGTASAAVTVAPDPVLETGLLEVLEGYDGIFQAQLVGDALIDLNPRVYGSLPLAVAAGVNLVGVWCALLDGADPDGLRGRAAEGVRYRWLEGDVRNAVARVRRHRSVRPMVELAGGGPAAAHSVESVTDPGPLLERARHVATTASSRGPLIAFSGVDGAGKSTLVAAVTAELARRGVGHTVVWTRPGMRLGPFAALARLASRASGQTEPGVRAVASGASGLPSRKGALGFAWATLVTVLYLFDVRTRDLRAKGVRVHDRHLADALVTLDFVYRGADLRLSRALIRRLVPRADLSFFLTIDPDVAVARKPGDSFGRLAVEAQLDAYDEALAAVEPLVRLDGVRPVGELVDEVLQRMLPLVDEGDR